MKKGSAIDGPTLLIGPTSSRLYKPDEVFDEIVNAYPTEEGSYRSIYRPAVLLPAAGGGAPSSGSSATHSPLQYGPVHGIHHGLLMGGQRDVLLLHTGDQVWEFRWDSRAWYPLIGPTGVSAAQITWQEHFSRANKWPTQWVTTPTGIVIIPQNQRAYFFDGVIVGELGFSSPPSPPVGLGPTSRTGEWDGTLSLSGVNDLGYSVHGLHGRFGKQDEHLGVPRVGTVFSPDTSTIASTTDPAHSGGYLLPGRWRCRSQYIDMWGNLSPISGPSNDVSVERQPSMYWLTPTTSTWISVDKARRQIAWEGISTGPQHTAGRILYRTKDLENSGVADYFELPINGSAVAGAFATLPDRSSTFYPDNVPDAWLSNRAVEIDPVPNFRLAALAFGRLWIANSDGDEGMLHRSEVGRWGTFPTGGKTYPDPKAAEITGLHAIDAGLLVFTETSTFLVEENDGGDGFRTRTLSTTAGCIAPSSIATTRDGTTVWLGKDGFYTARGLVVEFAFSDHRRHVNGFSKSRLGFSSAVFDNESGQYQCWVPVDGGIEPNRRYKFDGSSWMWDDYAGDVSMKSVVVKEGTTSTQLGCGTVGSDTGVWVIDRGGAIQEMTVKTGWIRSMRSRSKGTVYRVHLWIRETSRSLGVDANKIKVETRRNWRADVVDTFYAEPRKVVDASRTFYESNADFWPITVGDSTVAGASRIRRRRPLWVSVDVDIKHAEVFQLEISSTKKMEIVGLSITEIVSDDGGASAR